jgi:AraC-like DNA-binding protein
VEIQDPVFSPLQVPMLLGPAGSPVDYREFHPSGLEHLALAVWKVDAEPSEPPSVNRILPDGCIDIVADLMAETLEFAAFSRATEEFELREEAHQMGVRLAPGVFHQLFDHPAHLVMDTTVPFRELSPTGLEGFFDLADDESRVAVLADYVSQRGLGSWPSPLMRALPLLYDSVVNRVDEFAARLGYSPRQLSRLFYDEIGVAPRVFLNIVRLHRSLRLLASRERSGTVEGAPGDLAELAVATGFFDQPHFIREIRRYAGVSPLTLWKRLNDGRKVQSARPDPPT